MDKWTNTCRSCLTTSSPFSYYIHKDISSQTYLFCTSIEVKCDELPKSLCGTCYQLIKKFTDFKNMCIRSENKLLGIYKSLTHKNEACLDIKVEIENSKVDKVENALKFIKNDFGTDASKNDFCHVENTGVSELKLTKPTKKRPRVVKVKQEKSIKHDFKCEQCFRTFAFKERLEGHMLKHQGKIAAIQCKTCDKTFKQWSGLRNHIESIHSPRPFKDVTCQKCSKVCKTPSTLRTHQRTHEERRVRVCDECGKTFKSDVTFKNHLETHVKNRERNFPCEHCGKKYISKKTCAKHVYRRHTDRQFICNYCNYIFTDKANLIRHIMVHEGRRPKFKCDVCLKTLTAHASLVVHKRIHSGHRPYGCSHCPKRFPDRSGLVEHERGHTGEKPFQCAVCAVKFSRRGSLRRHMKVHK